MFVGICSLKTFPAYDFEGGVNPNRIVRVHLLAFAIDDLFGKILRINAARPELCVIVIKVLSLSDCASFSMAARFLSRTKHFAWSALEERSPTFSAWRSFTITSWGVIVASPNVIVPYPSRPWV